MDCPRTFEVKLVHAFDVRMNFHKRIVFGPHSERLAPGLRLAQGRRRARARASTAASWSTAAQTGACCAVDSVLEPNAHYMFEADDGALIQVHNRGYIYNTLPNSPGPAYFRCTPYFRAPVGQHDWLNRTVIVGGGQRHTDPDYTIFRYYAVSNVKRIDYIVVGGGFGRLRAGRAALRRSVDQRAAHRGRRRRAQVFPHPHAAGVARRVPRSAGCPGDSRANRNPTLTTAACPRRAARCWGDRTRSTVSCTCAAARRTTTTGPGADLPGWDYAGVLPYFRRSETQLARRFAFSWRHRSADHGALRNRRSTSIRASSRPPRRWASNISRTSTPRTSKGSRCRTATTTPANAPAPWRVSCVRRCRGRISRCASTRRRTSCCWTMAAASACGWSRRGWSGRCVASVR